MMRMRLATTVMAGMAVTMGIVAPMSASAQQLPEEIRVTQLNLKEADMIAATIALTKQTGLQFIVEPSDVPFPKITLSLSNISADEAIAYICRAAGATYRRDANGIYIISRASGAPVQPVNPVNTNANNIAAPKIAKKFKLKKADPRTVYAYLMGGNGFDAAAAFDEIQRAVQKQMAMSGGRMVGSPPVVLGGGPSFGATNTATLPKNTGAAANDIVLPGEEANALGAQGGGNLGGGGGGQGGGGGAGGQQGNSQLQAGSGLVGSSIDYISYDPTDNSIIVRGSEEDIAALQRYISMFDVAPKQVIVKVEFITTSSSLSRSLGFDWLYERGTVFAGNRPGSFARAGDPIFLSYATGNITARMRALLQTGNGRVVNAPVIRTLNNQPAIVQSAVTTTLFVNQVVSVGNGQTIIAPTPFTLTFNTFLGVTPRINDDGTVTAFINVQIADLGQLRRSPDGTEIPDQLLQNIAVVARVKAGETIALGGLTRKSETGSQARFPILGDLPIIGQFFRASNRDLNQSELIVFVTPTVVEDESNAGLGP